MSVSLKKGNSMSLDEMAMLAGLAGAGMMAGSMNQLNYAVGLGWDVSRKASSMDLDAWALVVDFNDKNEMVYFGNKKDKTKNIVHTGDNLTGAGDGDDETINIDLAPLTDKYKYILLGVTIYNAKSKRQSFADVNNAFVRVYDRTTGRELCRYADSFNNEFANCTTLVFGAFINDNGTWRFKAVGQSVNANGISSVAGLLIGAALLTMVNTPDSSSYDNMNNVGDNNTNNNNNLNGGKRTMGVSLSKGGKVSLAKVAADAGITAGLTKVVAGLGWDTNRYDGGAQFDLDAAAFMLGENGKVRSDADFIFYNNKMGAGVEHTGDNRTGEGDGDDEQIKIDLTAVPADVQKISFTVTIDQADTRNQNFGMVENSFIRIFDEATGTELIRYDLGEDFSVETAIVVGELYRNNGEWKFAAVGSGFAGGLAALCGNFGIAVE